MIIHEEFESILETDTIDNLKCLPPIDGVLASLSMHWLPFSIPANENNVYLTFKIFTGT